VSTPETRGWGPGWPTVRTADMRQLSWITGSVHKDIHVLMDLLCAETVRRGYRIRRDWSWGYANRPIGGTQRPSMHSWGLAIDINAPTNPMRRPLTTDHPAWMRQLWADYGFTWGGHWSTPDPMHYEFRGTLAEARVQTDRARRAFGVAASTSEEDALVETLVRGIQEELNRAGHRDRDGRALVVDGVWGPRTQAAFGSALTRQTGGLTQAQADARYARKGATVTITGSGRLP
jgi:hypothetical protein